ncbi:MAG: hypothetical protein KGZ68_04505, partial [Dechloromonas sp.]|nr:hypothetical protein [Dechloromonas sp.]
DPAANGWQTHYYGGSSIFSFSLSDEDSVMHINKPCEPASRLTYWQKGAEDAEFSAPKEDDL